MKKINLLLVILIILTATLYGCGNGDQSLRDIDTTTTTTTDTTEELDIHLFPEVDTTSKNLDVYRQEVSKRLDSLEEDDNFITDEEWSAITRDWKSVDILKKNLLSVTDLDTQYEEYYYPVVYRTGNSLVLWYTDINGSVLLERVYGHWNDSNYIGELHYDSSKAEVLSENFVYKLAYIQKTGMVSEWKFGKIVESYSVPKKSVYCGFSYFEGYIFRNGTDIYSLNAVGTRNTNGSVECIAHNVEYVIDADYHYGSDPWCQPLFLMTDGSIKAYIGWEGDQDSPDSTSHLCELQYEGGYK